MEKKQRVMIYGNSVILAGIKASISLDPNCEVVNYDMTSGQEEIYALRPDVIIFDLNAVQPDFHYKLAQELSRLPGQPRLLLIGIDPETNRALVWSGWEAKALSSQELALMIHQSNFSIPISRREK